MCAPAGAIRLGFVANFISEPVLTGFKSGIGLVIVLDQLPKLLGIHITKAGFFRDRAVKGRVEDGDVRNGRQRALGLLDRIQPRRVVQRRKRDERAYLLAHRIVDRDRLAEPRSPVNDAVHHGENIPRHLRKRADRPAVLVVVDEMQLHAGRPGVDDEDVRHARPAQPGQVQLRISGGSSPCVRPYARARSRLSTISCRR